MTKQKIILYHGDTSHSWRFLIDLSMSNVTRPADQLVTDLLAEIINVSRPTIIFVSGGSLLPRLQETFYRLMDKQRDYSHIEIALVDERYDPYPHHADSNYSQLMQLTCVPDMLKQGMKFTPILHEGKTLDETAKQYAEYVKLKLDNEDLKLICILGIGEDFHIAGILPHDFRQTTNFYQQVVVGYDVDQISKSDNPHRRRITLSFSSIEKMDEVWLYAEGENKQQVIKHIEQVKNSGKEVIGAEVAEKPGLFLTTLPRLRIYN